MNLLGAKLYDPAAAVSKSTASLLAMTALDTTNLRLAVTVPAHGMVRFRLRGVVSGATTCPTLLLGVLNGSAVVGRASPAYENATANASTQSFLIDAEFTATGLTPGAANFDAAYAVQVLVSSTNIKYGGPNTNAGANAWGGFLFEAWDPQPLQTNGQLAVDANGRVDVSKVTGTAQTARDLGAQLDAAISTRAPSSTALSTATWTNARAALVDNLDAAVSTRLATSGYTAPPAAAVVADAVWDEALSGHLTAGTTGEKLNAAGAAGDPWATALPGAYAAGTAGKILGSYTAAPTAAANATAVRTELATELARIDAATSSRLASASYTAPDNATISAIAGYVDTEVAAIKGVVDKLNTTMEINGTVYRFTASALSAPLENRANYPRR